MTKDKAGFTLVEIVVVLAILGLLVGAVVSSFFKITSSEALDKSAFLVVSVLEEARSMTLASREGSEYGVRFEPTRLIIFKGDSFVEGSPDNTVVELNSLVRVSATSLPGGGSEVVFLRLSGGVAEGGSVTLSLADSPTEIKVVNIHETGLSEVN